MTTLYLFDLDNTLVEFNQTELIPGVKEKLLSLGPDAKFAICSNQGGVGLRVWMELEGFGRPNDYPSEVQVRTRLAEVAENLGLPIRVYLCFAYQSKKTGKWGPTPDGCAWMPEWDHNNRKPLPGMLNQAIKYFGIEHDGELPEAVFFIGDGPEDMGAADNAGVQFITAETFFGRDSSDIPF